MPGKNYVLQTNLPSAAGSLTTNFSDFAGPIAVPPGFPGYTTNHLHNGAATNAVNRFYRVRLAP
jgi:hypothetical protein